MKVLFVMRSVQIFHYYESVVSALKKRGHSVSLLFDKKWSSDEKIVERYEWAVDPKFGFRRKILLFTREVRSWRRYLEIKGQSSFYAHRWLKYVSPKFRFLVKTFPFLTFFVKTKFVGRFLNNFEKNTKPDEKVIADIKKYAPDVVVAGPVCYRQSSADLEYLKAAKALDLPTVVLVMTWDTLTTKGIFHVIPDLLFVWNEAQIKEAEEHHGIGREKIKIVGAPFFDKWFNLIKSIGTTPPTPLLNKEGGEGGGYILYLGSSDNIAPDERWLIKEIKESVDVPVVFRPHPANFKIYQDFNMPGVTISPKNGQMPKTKESLQDLRDVFRNASAIVGVNTSAMIDAIVAGFPVIALEREEFLRTQMLAQHYQHLRDTGAVLVSLSKEDFPLIFSRLRAGVDSTKLAREQFIKNFIRPRGLEKSAGESAAEETELL